jgi:hypothetical protein
LFLALALNLLKGIFERSGSFHIFVKFWSAACVIFCNKHLAALATGFIECINAVIAANKMFVTLCIEAVVIIITGLFAEQARAKNVIVYFYCNARIKNIIFATEIAVWVLFCITNYATFNLIDVLAIFFSLR